MNKCMEKSLTTYKLLDLRVIGVKAAVLKKDKCIGNGRQQGWVTDWTVGMPRNQQTGRECAMRGWGKCVHEIKHIASPREYDAQDYKLSKYHQHGLDNNTISMDKKTRTPRYKNAKWSLIIQQSKMFPGIFDSQCWNLQAQFIWLSVFFLFVFSLNE